MTEKQTSMPQARIARRRQQEQSLRARDTELKNLASQSKQEEFFKQVTPFLHPLKSYIKRRLRVAYLTLDVRTPVGNNRPGCCHVCCSTTRRGTSSRTVVPPPAR